MGFYCVVAFALVAVIIYLLNPMAPTTTTTAPDIVIPTTSAPDVTTTSEPYCCKSKGLWSLDKKAWCCKHYGVGCPTTAPPAPVPPPAPTPPPEPNRAVGTPMTWDMGKKVWCCSTQGKACPPTAPPTPPPPTTSLPFDCNAGYHGCYHCIIKQWSVSKLA